MSPQVPLRRWRFDGQLRHYQADVLDGVDVTGTAPLHIVAPPGSGKTLLGLLLAMRRGTRALVLAPTVTIRDQWAETARTLAAGPDEVSIDGDALRDLSALTYQAVSVLDGDNPLAALAHDRWLRELEADGRSERAASEWLDDLRSGNSRAYASGIARRSRTLRRRIAQEDPDALMRALHPRARALIERLVAHRVDTIVLDECHHLLDHWALVVAALVAQLRAAGRSPLVIGLTATLPSPDDGTAYDNYTAILGDVDHEVPVPAVVREGNLAPYREYVRFVEPTADEVAFLSGAATALAVLIRATFARGAGADHLVDVLQPPLPHPEPVDEPDAETSPPPALRLPPARPEEASTSDTADIRLSRAFADDFAGAEAAAAMLSTVHPDHPLVARLPALARRPPTTDEALRLLGRFALDRVLPDASAREQWDRIRATLADFGFSLTDRGLRRTRDPIDTMLASSLAKDRAACDILRLERDHLGPRLRALIVTDFSEHGNRHGGLIGPAGAVRTFGVLTTDAATADLRGALITGSTTRVATRHADALAGAFSAALDAAVMTAPVADDPGVTEIAAPGVGAATFVRAAAALLTRGELDVVVGTRGLFGEGWDCPAVNTLIDLTSVATPAATQQLRGRTLRLDPAWPDKVAHNWTVTALLPPAAPLHAVPDLERLRRKHAQLWGLHRDDPGRIVRGLSSALTGEQQRRLDALDRPAAADLDALTVLIPREHTHAMWRVGEPYDDREEVGALVARRAAEPAFRTRRRADAALARATAALGVVAVGALALMISGPVGLAIGSALLLSATGVGVPVAVAWLSARRAHASAPELYRRVGLVVVAALRRAGRVGSDVRPKVIIPATDGGGGMSPPTGIQHFEVVATGASLAEQRLFASAMSELFAAVRTPRRLLQVDAGGRSPVVRWLLARANRSDPSQFLAVPTAIGGRAANLTAFVDDWQRHVGPCVLHVIDGPESLAILAEARRTGAVDGDLAVAERWH
ncbi:DEAD/DEAH box helicase family protein [Microbacterium thalli]|uniref:DEAD/DEAH box helicase family protein n=1 Tax=Microbacterium thalli TaxID=3027921 RepID=A0ABT5SMJ0_9MICO|nr:DEAD/DEAH box helicase family protein [Microbacterium thalli]MDD7963003.1 DEAD/DEAH box helicase family protein [Microbacterium thalli]